MTLEPFVGKPVDGEPRLWPPWAYLTLAGLTTGTIVALAVLAVTSWTLQRQGTHMAENRAAVATLNSMATQVKHLESEVEGLRAYADELRSRSEANRRRIEAVEGTGGGDQGRPDR